MQYVTTGWEGLELELAICHHWVGGAGVRTMQYVTTGWEGLE